MKVQFPLTDAKALLRKVSLRATPQRAGIASLLFAKPRHITAQQVYESLQPSYPNLSLNTVYLTLAHFEKCGLLRRFTAGGSTIYDSNNTPHHHALCQSCGSVTDVMMNSEQPFPQELSQWQLIEESRIWLGHCPTCRQYQ